MNDLRLWVLVFPRNLDVYYVSVRIDGLVNASSHPTYCE
jgi:hypothetical protein